MKDTTAKEILAEANDGIVGINEKLEIHTGYDNYILEASNTHEDLVFSDAIMTSKEKILLAETMIKRWEEYKAGALSITVRLKINLDDINRLLEPNPVGGIVRVVE